MREGFFSLFEELRNLAQKNTYNFTVLVKLVVSHLKTFIHCQLIMSQCSIMICYLAGTTCTASLTTGDGARVAGPAAARAAEGAGRAARRSWRRRPRLLPPHTRSPHPLQVQHPTHTHTQPHVISACMHPQCQL